MTYAVELTDTFGGEANYSWVRRASVSSRLISTSPVTYQRTVIRRAKAAVGMTGVRGVTHRYGDGYEFRPYGMCQVMFVQWDDGAYQ